MDEQAGVLSGGRRWRALAALVLLASCRFTEVALVTVRNDTAAPVGVRARLPGDPSFRENLTLAPAQESTLLKYEEPRSEARPMPSLVDGLKLVNGPCEGTLEAPAVAQAAVRTEKPRRWTVRVTPALLTASGCASPAQR